jgi:hypothetical protein
MTIDASETGLAHLEKHVTVTNKRLEDLEKRLDALEAFQQKQIEEGDDGTTSASGSSDGSGKRTGKSK